MKFTNRVLQPIPNLAFERGGFHPRALGFTLAEVLISLAIAAMVFSGVITAYVQSSYRAEWSGYSLAAQSLAIQQLEQARAANWDVSTIPVRNEITNVPTVTSAILDLPVNGTNIVWATNYTTISSIAITNTVGASVYMVRVDTAWPFNWAGKRRYYTNTVADIFAPD
jgi:prepilin-type N-terminal cleavage/methylation domain-containing protein